jgi:excisionase family DNA binding protein
MTVPVPPNHRVPLTWTEGLLDELAMELAVHPRFEALVQERVEQTLMARGNVQERRWLTLREAAERLGCTPDAVRMRISRGRLDHRRQGRRLYVSAASVDRLGPTV